MVTKFMVLSICSSAVCISLHHDMLVYVSAACHIYVHINIYISISTQGLYNGLVCTHFPFKFYAEVCECMLANTDCVYSPT